MLAVALAATSSFHAAPSIRRTVPAARPPQASLATTVAPAVGACLANGMFFSGLPEVLEKRRQGDLGEFNPLPMPIIMGNTIGWTVYALLTKDVFVAAANAPGLLLSGWYVLTTSRLAEAATAKRIEIVAMLMASIHLAAGLACAFLLPTRAAMVSLYGLVCNGILLAYYGAPLSSMQKVVTERSAESIYYPTVALNGVNALFWSTYALAISDRYLLVPNAIGVGLCALQTLLCLIFGKFNLSFLHRLTRRPSASYQKFQRLSAEVEDEESLLAAVEEELVGTVKPTAPGKRWLLSRPMVRRIGLGKEE